MLPRGGGLGGSDSSDTQTKRHQVQCMKDEISWKNCKGDKDGQTRTWWRQTTQKSNGGMGPRGMTIPECCEWLWDKYDLSWRNNVKLRKANEDRNFP